MTGKRTALLVLLCPTDGTTAEYMPADATSCWAFGPIGASHFSDPVNFINAVMELTNATFYDCARLPFEHP